MNGILQRSLPVSFLLSFWNEDEDSYGGMDGLCKTGETTKSIAPTLQSTQPKSLE
jgi:hypothetical protein